MNITQAIQEQNAPKEMSLHEKRWKKATEALPVPTNSMHSTVKKDEADSKEPTIKPLVYYNVQECLRGCMNNQDYIDLASKNIGIVRTSRAQKGQRVSEPKDLKDVQGEIKEGTNAIRTGFEKLKYHTFVRTWCGAICVFEIEEQMFGFGQAKRTGYMLNKVYVAYYGKNNIKISKELILRCAFWMKKKPVER